MLRGSARANKKLWSCCNITPFPTPQFRPRELSWCHIFSSPFRRRLHNHNSSYSYQSRLSKSNPSNPKNGGPKSGAGFTLSLAPTVLALPVYAAVIVAFGFSEDDLLGGKRDIQKTFSFLWASSQNDTSMDVSSSIARGRPETLTAEEEKKLKEFWTECLKLFGVIPCDTPAIPLSPEPPSTPTTPTDEEFSTGTTSNGDGPKKKKVLGRLLSRKDKKSDDKNEGNNSVLATSAPVLTDDSDDKYGHTKEFKAALASQTPADLREAFWSMVKCDNPDGLLLRFLRARKWDVQKALAMMVVTMKWRVKEGNVAGVIRRGEVGAIAENDDGFMKQLRMGKSFLHGVDKEGRPICHVRVRLHKQADQTEESLERYNIYIMETARLMLRTPVDTACVIFDMTNFSLANLDYAPVKFTIKCFEAHYPESLGNCIIHKAPWVFQGVWSVVKGWLDPVVASKVHFTKTTEELEQYIHRSHILKELGGDEDWDFKYIEPVPGEDEALNDTARLAGLQAERDETVKQYEELTKIWVGAEGQESDSTKAERTKLAKKLETGYWCIDRHLRGRTVYDRTGILGPDGGLDFYPAKKPSPTAPTSADDVE